jgi:hypothetical protein
MMKQLICIINILFVLTVGTLAQNLNYSQKVIAKIIEQDNQNSISFVNIAILGTNYGTISNSEGNFSISIPSQYSNDKLVFSCIGYKKDTISIREIRSNAVIKLEKQVNEIQAVIVMPENTLKRLLQKAWDKIPDNYPTTHTYYKGFFRETSKDDKGNYLSFGEAYIESVRGSVELKKDKGQIKIIKSRGGNLSRKDSITPIHFYGGIFLGTQDFVQRHRSFINPLKFNKYKYQVQKVDNYYKITFRNKENEGYSGYFLLDTLNYAYKEAKYIIEAGLEIESRYKKLTAEHYEKFTEINGKYYLKYSYFTGTGIDKITKKKIIHFDEYLSSEILLDYKELIPEKEQVKFFDVFIDKIPDYSSTYWDDYTIIESDSLLKREQLAQEKITSILDDVNKQTKKDWKQLLLAFCLKSSLRCGISYSVPKIKQGKYSFVFPTINHTIDKDITQVVSWSLNGTISYYFNNNFAFVCSSESELSNNSIYKDIVFGMEVKKQINHFGKDHSIYGNVGIGRATSILEIGSFKNSETIKWGNKNIDANQIAVYSGNQSWILKPSLGFSRYYKGLCSFYVSLGMNIPFSGDEVIALKEKKGLFKKTGFEKIENTSVSIYRDNLAIENTGFDIQTFTITCGIKFFN